jgi:hypothetical protein
MRRHLEIRGAGEQPFGWWPGLIDRRSTPSAAAPAAGSPLDSP